jgi:hypothetical protein
MSENAMSIFELDARKRNLSFSNIQKQRRIKKKRVALNHFMEKNLNVLSRLCHKIPRSRRCKSIRSVLKADKFAINTLNNNI